MSGIFLENKKTFYSVLMDAKEALDKKNGKKQKISKIYKKAYVSKQVFSSIFNGVIPQKDTVFKLAFALESSLEEAEEILKYAGYSFGNCIKRDLILKSCFEKGIIDILEIN
ncbi:MAG: hypothetical protein FWH22_07895, partial [Fibromonadales bacterium]|nr:hypothetical protein [Fibromonadales bacterium]